ncbi:serine/threonine protein phosphatase [Dehalococcoides mccartyi]|nr:serine/threonine protein phosphatase [Dehalococcoides mccartyi]AQU06940.1 serine/threonine protein phosphatase [Dehalococcoides mccartyi]
MDSAPLTNYALMVSLGMRYAVMADIHANLEALNAVLEDAYKRDATEIWCLGDIINYGPDPTACLEILMNHKHLAVAGNHDLAVAGKINHSLFELEAARCLAWTRSQLSSDMIDYLAVLPEMLIVGDFSLVHGSLKRPVWDYITTPQLASENFGLMRTPYCLVGHTHMPYVFTTGQNGICRGMPLMAGSMQPLRQTNLIINPGSVGQPRDGNPQASYGIYNDEARTFCLYRVAYNIPATQKKMQKAKLPTFLSARLSKGR